MSLSHVLSSWKTSSLQSKVFSEEPFFLLFFFSQCFRTGIKVVSKWNVFVRGLICITFQLPNPYFNNVSKGLMYPAGGQSLFYCNSFVVLRKIPANFKARFILRICLCKECCPSNEGPFLALNELSTLFAFLRSLRQWCGECLSIFYPDKKTDDWDFIRCLWFSGSPYLFLHSPILCFL